MNNKILILIAALGFAFLPGCANMSQAVASATFITAEATTAALLKSNPQYLPTLQLLTQDWTKLQNGTLLPVDQVTLLKSITASTAGKLDPVKAALLDGAVTQLLANQNNSAPSPLTGGAAFAVTDMMNGVARALLIYTAPVPTA